MFQISFRCPHAHSKTPNHATSSGGDSPLGQLVLAGTRRPGKQTHVPRSAPGVLAAVGALLDAEEGVEIAPTPAVVELNARFLARVISVP